MSVYKEEKTNTWRVIYRYTDWTGQRKQSQKRGFKTKREAQAWEREQMNKATADLDMTFESFIKLTRRICKAALRKIPGTPRKTSSTPSSYPISRSGRSAR